MEQLDYTSNIEYDNGVVLLELQNSIVWKVEAAMIWNIHTRDSRDAYRFIIDKDSNNDVDRVSRLIRDFIDSIQQKSERRFFVEIVLNNHQEESTYTHVAHQLQNLNYIDKYTIIGNHTDWTKTLVLVCEGS